AFLICVFIFSSHTLEDDDFFWHLSTGRFIIENKYVPGNDIFSFPSGNAEWIPFEWGWDVLSYELYSIGGYNSVSIFSSLIFCLGALAGLLLLFIFVISEIIIYYYPSKFSGSNNKPLDKKQLKILVLLSAVSALVLLINPHGIETYAYAYSHTKMKMLESISE